MRSIKIRCAFLLACFLSLPLAAYDDLDLSSGTMMLGGKLSFPMQFDKGKTPSVGVVIAPQFGYFIVDGLAFVLGGSYERLITSSGGNISADVGNSVTTLGRSAEITTGNIWGLLAGLAYYIDLGGAAFPYLGALAQFGWPGSGLGTLIQATIPLGVLVSLNEHVALDFGIGLHVDFATGRDTTKNFLPNGYLGVGLEPGYIGVRAFF